MKKQKPPSETPPIANYSSLSPSLLNHLSNKTCDGPLLEQELIRYLNHSSNLKELIHSLHTVVNYLGQCDYSLIRLDAAEQCDDKKVLTPTLLACSYPLASHQRRAILTQAKFSDISHRHVSMLYHFIASVDSSSQLFAKHPVRYVLVTSVSHREYFIVVNNNPSCTGHINLSTPNTIQHRTNSTNAHLQTLQRVVNAVAYIGCKQFPSCFSQRRHARHGVISRQPQRLLNIIALQDATLHQAAKQLGLTINTINKHMATAKSALGTQTIAGTVWKAICEGLIDC